MSLNKQQLGGAMPPGEVFARSGSPPGRLWGEESGRPGRPCSPPSRSTASHGRPIAVATNKPQQPVQPHILLKICLPLSRSGVLHTQPSEGKAAMAASPGCFFREKSVGGVSHSSVESLGYQLLCGRVEFHPQNTYGETNWKLQWNMQNLHCASFRGTTRIPVKFINTVHMQSIELSK